MTRDDAIKVAADARANLQRFKSMVDSPSVQLPVDGCPNAVLIDTLVALGLIKLD